MANELSVAKQGKSALSQQVAQAKQRWKVKLNMHCIHHRMRRGRVPPMPSSVTEMGGRRLIFQGHLQQRKQIHCQFLLSLFAQTNTTDSEPTSVLPRFAMLLQKCEVQASQYLWLAMNFLLQSEILAVPKPALNHLKCARAALVACLSFAVKVKYQ